MKRSHLLTVILLVLLIFGVLPALAAPDTAPQAQGDALDALKSENNNFGAGALFADNGSGADNLGEPAATISNFGGGSLGGFVTDNNDGDTVTFAGGQLTINANGSLTLDNPTSTGTFTVLYRLSNTDGDSDALVTFTITEIPIARRDRYEFPFNVNQLVPSGSGLFQDNGFGPDVLGVPTGSLTNFGVGTPADVDDNAAGDTIPFAGGSLQVNSDGSWNLTGAPFTPGQHDFRYRLANSIGSDLDKVIFIIQAVPVARDDSLKASLTVVNNYSAGTLFADNGSGEDERGYPMANISSFGGGSLGGSVTDNAAGSTVALGASGANLKVNANGSMVIDSGAVSGTYTFLYRLENDAGSSDASVTIRLSQSPTAKGDSYSFINTANQSFNAAAGLFANNGSGTDILGDPPAVLYSYGGGSLGGTVTDNLSAAPVPLAGGTLIVNSDGSWSLNGAPFQHGNYTFSYRLQNIGGTSDALVSLTINGAPAAEPDSLTVKLGSAFVLPAPGLFSNNGSGADDLGTPEATLVSFGGGDVSADVGDNGPGATVLFAGGTLTVNATGSLNITGTTTPGEYTFNYRLQNAVSTSEAQVTVLVAEPPLAKKDKYQFLNGANQTFNAAAGLFANNGSGADDLGQPAATLTTFGGGSLGGGVTGNAAGASVALAGGTLKVNANGSWTLSGAPFTPGEYTFDYRLSNAGGASDETVTLDIRQAPIAEDDALTGEYGVALNFDPGTLFGDNGSGPDVFGYPTATLKSFGGGDLGGSVGDHNPGASVPFAGGTLQVNADGSLTVDTPTETGQFTFLYRLQNAEGNSDATVTVDIQRILLTHLPIVAR